VEKLLKLLMDRLRGQIGAEANGGTRTGSQAGLVSVSLLAMSASSEGRCPKFGSI